MCQLADALTKWNVERGPLLDLMEGHGMNVIAPAEALRRKEQFRAQRKTRAQARAESKKQMLQSRGTARTSQRDNEAYAASQQALRTLRRRVNRQVTQVKRLASDVGIYAGRRVRRPLNCRGV